MLAIPSVHAVRPSKSLAPRVYNAQAAPHSPEEARARLELVFRLADYLAAGPESSVYVIADDLADDEGHGPSPELVEEVLSSFACFACGLSGWVVLPAPLQELQASHQKESRYATA